MEAVFENLNCPAFFSLNKAVLSLFSNGRSSGICVESGAYSTDITPVHDGYFLRKNSAKIPYGGENLTKEILAKIDIVSGFHNFMPYFDYVYENRVDGARNTTPAKNTKIHESFRDHFRMRVAREIKESYIKVPTKSNTDAVKEKLYHELPDGNMLEINKEFHSLTEKMFSPKV